MLVVFVYRLNHFILARNRVYLCALGHAIREVRPGVVSTPGTFVLMSYDSSVQ